ncbi:MAG TPA: hypothetical protein VFA26_21915, partial [Gemmataceae bacterium]|nr:hypothetical protein [Gemmataceae bacterium]
RPGGPERAGEESAACALHPGNASTGLCQRCGNFVCSVCRTRFRGQTLCLACVERFLAEQRPGSGLTNPEEAGAHKRQAIIAAASGVASWALLGGGLLLIVLGVEGGPTNPLVLLVLVGFALMMAGPAVSAVGIGQALAALRTRGNYMILATAGLILSCLQAGALIGLVAFNTFHG